MSLTVSCQWYQPKDTHVPILFYMFQLKITVSGSF